MALLRRSLRLFNLRNRIVSIRYSSEASNLNITEIQIPIHNNLVQAKWYGDKSIQPILALDGSLDKKHKLDKIARKLNGKSVLMIDMSDAVVPLPPLPTKPILGCSVDVSPSPSSSRSPCPNSLEWLIIIRSVVKHFKWKRVTLLGHLLGAQLSFLYAGMFPAEMNVLIAMERCLPNVHELYDGPENLARIIEQIMETESLNLNPDQDQNQKLNEKRDVTQYGDTNTNGVAAITNTNPIWGIKGTPWLTHPEILGYASRIISPTLILDNKGNRNNSVEQLRLQEVLEIMFKQGTYVKHLDDRVGDGDDIDDIARIIDCFIDERCVYK